MLHFLETHYIHLMLCGNCFLPWAAILLTKPQSFLLFEMALFTRDRHFRLINRPLVKCAIPVSRRKYNTNIYLMDIL